MPTLQPVTTSIAINGTGRIGRVLLRTAAQRQDLRVVGLNDLVSAQQTAHLLRHDSTLGPFPVDLETDDSSLRMAGHLISYSQQANPEDIPWGTSGPGRAVPDLVVEATGQFTSRADAARHLHGGARRVIVSANAGDADALVCFGINHQELRVSDEVVSAGSCTTNCVAAVLAPLAVAVGIEKVMLMTVHCYNSNQSLVDSAQRDLRRSRAAGLNLIPTTTGATWALEMAMPELAGRVSGYAVRVPSSQVSLVDLVVQTKKTMTTDEVVETLHQAADSDLKGILGVSAEPLVSTDFVGDSRSAIVDLEFVGAEDRHVRIMAWYDNESGYAHRLADLAVFMGNQS